jgi:hypothetical protein
MIGPNEIDAMDGLAPVATIVSANVGSDTRSSLLGGSQFNAGQSELVFFKDSLTRTSSIPPEGQLIRLSYRSAGPAIGRSVDRDSVLEESAKWGDDGIRSIVRSDLTPRPRTSEECELAASALVSESSFVHYDGSYEQWDDYFSVEPKAGAVIKFTNIPAASGLNAEEINEVVTTIMSSSPTERFMYSIKFGKPDKVRRLLSKFQSVKGSFQRSGDAPVITAVHPEAVGLGFAPDVTKPVLTGWDEKLMYIDAGQDLDSNGLHFEVRYTDDSWGVNDGKNLITRSTSRNFTVPRNLRGRTFCIRQVVNGNRIKWSEDLTQASVYSGSSVTKVLKANPNGDIADICTVSFSAGGNIIGSVPGLSGSEFCFSFSIKGPVGETVTAFFGSASKSFNCTGFWQRVSVSYTGSAPSQVRLVADHAISVDLTQLSVEQGTLVETAYTKTTGTLYGPVSRHAAVVRVSFPAVESTSDPASSENFEAAGNVTLGTPQVRYSEPDKDGKVYAEITLPVTPPDPRGLFDRVLVQLQAPDDVGKHAEVGEEGGWTIPATVQFTPSNLTTDLMSTLFAHPFANGNSVRVRNVGGSLPTGLSDNVLYYMTNVSGTAFKLSLSPGGPPVDVTSFGVGAHFVYAHDTSGILPVNEPEVSFERIWKEDEPMIKVTFEVPAKRETWRIYVASGTPYVMNKVVRADQIDPTPNVMVEVAPSAVLVSGEEYAPNAKSFSLYTEGGITNPSYSVDRTSGTREWWVNFTWEDPESTHPRLALLGSYVVVAENLSTGKVEDDEAMVAFGWQSRVATSGIREVPAQKTTYRFWLVSKDVKGNRNTRVFGVTPSIDVDVEFQSGGPGAEYAPLATGFRLADGSPYYTTQDGGDGLWGFGVRWNKPDVSATPSLGGYDVVIDYLDGRKATAASLSANDDPAWDSDQWPVPNGTDNYDVWFVSWDTSGRRNTIVDGVTPKVSLTVQRQAGGPGVEYCANVTAFDVGTVEYDVNGQGQKIAKVPFSWTRPSDSRFGGVIIYLRYPPRFDAGDVALTGIEPGTSVTSSIPFYPDEPENWEFYAVAVDTNNRRNSYVSGVTPSEVIAVGPPALGSTGQEYTSVVSGLSVNILYQRAGEGQEQFRFSVAWTNPDDSTFGGPIVVVKKTAPGDPEFSEADYRGPEDNTHLTRWREVNPGETYTVYVNSMDVNNQENTIYDPVTPKVTGLSPVFQTSGKLKAHRLDSTTVGTGLQIDTTSFVLRVPLSGITTDLVNNFAVTEDKLQNAQIINAARIKNAAIENLKLDRASANKIAIVDADIMNLAVNKLLAGTITVAVAMTAPDLTITTGTDTVKINATDRIKVTNSASSSYIQIFNGSLAAGSTLDGTISATLGFGGLSVISGSSNSGLTAFDLKFNGNVVVKTRQGPISDPGLSGSVIDIQARQAISQILTILRASTGHGLISG